MKSKRMKRPMTLRRPGLLILNVLLFSALCSIITTATFHMIYMNSGKVITMEKHNAILAEQKAVEMELQSQVAQAEKQLQAKGNELKKEKENTDRLKKELATLNKNTDYLVSKYWYYYRDKPKSATVNLAELQLIDKLGKEKNINPHAVVGLIKAESTYNRKVADTSGNSNSVGYGQFLGSTGKFVYKKILQRGGEYNHREMATNGPLSIEMIYAYLDYCMGATKGDLREALELYNRSYRKEAYAESINQFLKSRNLGTLASATYR